jgi:hypothetical protein
MSAFHCGHTGILLASSNGPIAGMRDFPSLTDVMFTARQEE